MSSLLRLTISIGLSLELMFAAASVRAEVGWDEVALVGLTRVPSETPGTDVAEFAPGPELVTSRLTERLDRLEADLESLKKPSRLPASVPSAHYARYATEAPLRSYHPLRCGVELLIAKPRLEDGAEEDEQTNVTDFKLDASPRIWAELTSADGLSLLGHYWQYSDVTANVSEGGRRENMRIEAYTIDLECVQDLTFGPWGCTVGMGFQNAWFQQEVALRAPSGVVSKTFHAVGPIASAQLRRWIGRRGLSLFGQVNASVLAGEAKWRNDSHLQTTDDIGSILQMQLGMQWLAGCNRLGQWSVGSFWEQQYWSGVGTFFDGATTPGAGALSIQPDDQDVGFMGFGFLAELRR